MKNLLFITSFGLAVVFSNTAFGQEVKDNDTTKKVNARSNGKNNADRNFGKDRAATVQEMNGKAEKLADKQGAKTVDKEVKETDKTVTKEQKKKEKAARKQDKERLKAEKKLMKNSKIK